MTGLRHRPPAALLGVVAVSAALLLTGCTGAPRDAAPETSAPVEGTVVTSEDVTTTTDSASTAPVAPVQAQAEACSIAVTAVDSALRGLDDGDDPEEIAEAYSQANATITEPTIDTLGDIAGAALSTYATTLADDEAEREDRIAWTEASDALLAACPGVTPAPSPSASAEPTSDTETIDG